MPRKKSAFRTIRLSENQVEYLAQRPLTEQDVLDMAQKLLKKRLLRTEVLTVPTTTRSYLVTRFSTREHEVFGCLFLNNRHRVIELREMFRGTIDGASV